MRFSSDTQLFAVSSLVSIHDQTWTTNRFAAARRWGQVQPELLRDLNTLLRWGDTAPIGISNQETMNMLTGTVAKVIDDFSQQIGLRA